MRIIYNRWGRGYKGFLSDEEALAGMDDINKTRFSKRTKNTVTLEEAARWAHENRKLYFVTAFEKFPGPQCWAERPYAFMEINLLDNSGGALIVGFLDELKRVCMTYTFHEVEVGKRLFLSTILHWEFANPEDEKGSYFERVNFTTDGECFWYKKPGGQFSPLPGEQYEAAERMDVSKLWEPFPEFGHYEGLLRADRDIPPQPPLKPFDETQPK